MAILGHIEIQLFYVCSYQSRKQTNKNKTARERKERKKKETETGRAKRDIQKIWRSEVRPEQSCGYRCGRFTFTRSLLHKRGVEGRGGVYIGSDPESLISRRDVSILYLNVGSIPSMFA